MSSLCLDLSQAWATKILNLDPNCQSTVEMSELSFETYSFLVKIFELWNYIPCEGNLNCSNFCTRTVFPIWGSHEFKVVLQLTFAAEATASLYIMCL